jgi:uncharacterized protein YndB with AHSA1/START domain
MKGTFTATESIRIKAKAERIWDALTNPKLIKLYLFGTEVSSEWKVGSSITYQGVWQGKPYKDKGKILELVPKERLRSTFWSSLSGLPDHEDNYNTITYELAEAGGETILTISQDNNPTQDAADHSKANWASVLTTMKELLESQHFE